MTGGGPQRRWRLVRASTDAVPASVRRLFMSRQRRRRDAVQRRRRWVAAGAVGALVAIAGWLVWGTPLVSVERVDVRGVDVLTSAEVRRAAGVADGTPLLRVPVGKVAARVDALAPVDSVDVRRSWPDTVVVQVTERTAVAAVPRGDEFALVDRAGVAFQTVAQPPAALPVVVVDGHGEPAAATDAALTVLAALTPELRRALETLVVAGPVHIRLELSSGWTVRWGDESQSRTKARVATALLDREGELMDVSAPSVVSVR